MKAVRIVLVSLLVLLLGVGMAAWLLPARLDWAQHRQTLESLASAVLGREVRIAGALRVTLLPEAALEAGRLTLADAGDGVDIRAESVSLRVRLLPLLRGRVDAQELVLRGAELRVPWPPARDGSSLQPPTWLTGLAARFENSRVVLGALRLEGLSGTVASVGPAALEVRATGTLDRRPLRFVASLGRAGGDGAAPLEVNAEVPGTNLRLAGVLASSGNFTGRMDVATADLSAFVRAPAVPARLGGRLSADGSLIAADELSGDVGGSAVRAAVTVTLSGTPRLDAAIAATQLDLEPWLAAASAREPPALPTGLDLSVESVAAWGTTLRRVRAALELDQAGAMVREIEATLPSDAVVHLAGRIGRGRGGPSFEGQARVQAPAPHQTLAWAAPGLLPAAAVVPPLVAAAGLAWADGQLVLRDIAGEWGGTPVSGSARFVTAPRPRLSAMLTVAELALDPWLPRTLAELRPAADAHDLDLVLTLPRATFAGQALSGVSLDLSRRNGQLAVRRADATVAGSTLQAGFNIAADGAVSDGRLALVVPELGAWHGLLPAALRRHAVPWRGAARVSVTVAGPAAALAVAAQAEAAEARLTAELVVNAEAWRAQGTAALQHPGAPRFLSLLGWSDTAAWLGDGSFALAGQIGLSRQAIGIEGASLTAGQLRAAGALGWTVAEQRLTGRIQAETLPLPLPFARSPEPLGLAALRGWSAELGLAAQRIVAGGSPLFAATEARIELADGQLAVRDLVASIAGGELRGEASLAAAAPVPQLALALRLAGATIANPLLEQPFDLTAGQADAEVNLQAAGHSPAALLASLGGSARLNVADGVLTGFDLGAISAALADDGQRAAAEGIIRRALSAGATAFDRLTLAAEIERGSARLTQAEFAGEAGFGRVAGSVELSQSAYALRWALRPAVPQPPELGLTVTGTADAPQRALELAPALRWLAAQP